MSVLFTYKYLSSPLSCKFKQIFVITLQKLILNSFSATPLPSLIPSVETSLNTKNLFFDYQ